MTVKEAGRAEPSLPGKRGAEVEAYLVCCRDLTGGRSSFRKIRDVVHEAMAGQLVEGGNKPSSCGKLHVTSDEANGLAAAKASKHAGHAYREGPRKKNDIVPRAGTRLHLAGSRQANRQPGHRRRRRVGGLSRSHVAFGWQKCRIVAQEETNGRPAED